MNKRKFIYCLSFVISCLLFAGCNDLKVGNSFLEKAPGTDVTIDTIFGSKIYAERALVSAYATLRCAFPMGNNAIVGLQGSYEYKTRVDHLGADSQDCLTDIINNHCNWGGAYSVYYSGSYDATTENSDGTHDWQYYAWLGIRKAFLYINNVDKVPDMSDTEKTERKAEAKMIIACQYADLIKRFGGVPLLNTDVEVTNQESTDYTRQTIESSINYVLKLCDEAAKDLPWTVTSADDGRFTKAGALALKVRMLQFEASPLFNANTPYAEMPALTASNTGKIPEDSVKRMVWLGGYSQARWTAVKNACEAFFAENDKNGNPYKLVQPTTADEDGYRTAFRSSYTDRYNGEILIATCRQVVYFNNMYLGYYFGPSIDVGGNNGRGYGGGCITLNYVDMFPYTNGEKASYTTWIANNGHSGTFTKNPFVGRDPRLYESVMIVGDHFRSRPAEMWIGGRERNDLSATRAITGFSMRKYLADYDDATFNYKPANYAYLRLPEIYLAYAEALNELGQKQDAYKWLNKTRERVGLPDMTDNMLTRLQGDKTLPDYSECNLQGDKMLREEILDERAREFCFEEQRWYDMTRWKRSDIFQKKLYGITINLTSGSVSNNNVVLDFSDPYDDAANPNGAGVSRYWQSHFTPKWYLSAFPSDEINKGYGLVQNPGWQ
jgi:hypothetical protein